MTGSSMTEALARATSALVGAHDTTDLLAALLLDAVQALGGAAGGLVLTDEADGLELLAATSHVAGEVELYQIQHRGGPCHEAARDGAVVSCRSAADITSRWGDVGEAIVGAGFTAVHAFPVTWGGEPYGALNVFHAATPQGDEAELVPAGRAFADVASLVIVAPQDVDGVELGRRKRLALAGRTAVEQAKGVIAFREDVPTDEAYVRLVELASAAGVTLTGMARRVLQAAVDGVPYA